MKKIYLLVLLCLASISAFALNGPSTPGGPGTGFSGTTTYCVGAAAGSISYNYSECSIGVGPATSVASEVTWYYNTTNTTAITGSTVLVSGPTAFMSAPGTNGDLPSVTPITTSAGTYYYFAVVTWTEPGTCASPFVTSTIPVTINAVPASITGSSAVCVGSTMVLTDATSGGTWSSSDVTVATVGSSSGVVTGVAAGVADITYTITSTGCTAVSTITVNPLPAVITGTPTLCLFSTTTLANATAGGNWTSGNASVATVDASGVVTSVAAGTASISYTLSTGCTRTQVVTVNPTPPAIGGTASVCTGLTTTLSNSMSGGTWSSGNTAVAVISGTGVVTPVSAGTAEITYTLSTTGCYKTVVVTVNQSPAAITGTASVCDGLTSTLSNATSGGIWSSSNSAVASVSFSTGVVTGNTPGNATITYTLGSGCRATVSFTVNPSPASITGSASVCIGFTSTLSNSVSGGAWSSSDPSVATIGAGTGVVTSVSVGTSNITYTLPAGCTAVTTVTVNALPAAITGTMTACVGATTTLSDPDAGGTWASSNTSVATIGTSSGVVSGVSAGTANITYTLPTGCRAIATITVNSLPSAITGSASVCIGFNTTLSSATSGGAWTTSNAAIATVSSSGVVTGVAAGMADITYTVGTGCFRVATVTVNSLPSAITGTGVVCVASTTALSNASTGGTWASSSSSIASVGLTSGIVTGVTAGTATITYRLATGCLTTTVVTVNGLPAAISGTPTLCEGATTTFTNATGGGVWSSSDATVASISTGGVVTAVSAGNAVISYTLGTGCYRTTNVTVNPQPAAITGTGVTCVGGTTNLSNATAGGTWATSNGGVASVGVTSGIVTGVSGGTAIITYRLSTTCNTTTIVTINPLPSAITGSTLVCVGANATLSDATPGGAWTTSDATIATVGGATGIVTGVSAGAVTITYTLGTGCFRTLNMTVNSLPAAITGTTVICVGATATLADATSGGAWTSGNTGIVTVGLSTGVITGVAAGTANITYTLTTGCTAIANVTVNPIPAAITGPLNVCLGLTTTLNNATGGGAWSSSDATVASISGTGVVTGNAIGVATISYTLGTGCFRTVNVTVNALPAAITGTMTTCPGQTTTLADATTGGTWTSGTTTVATVVSTTGVVTGIAAGTANITYTLSTGCIAVATVTVNALPATITGTAGVCVGLTTTLSSTTGGGAWTTSNGAIATVDAAGVVTGVAPGNATISYTLGTGCFRTVNVTVNSLPATLTGTGTVCVGSTTSLASATTGGAFTSSTTSVATVNLTTGVVTGIGAGTSTITYTLSTGCTTTTVVTVNALPAVITGTATVCVASTRTLSSATAGGAWASGNTAVATIDAGGVVTGVATGTSMITYTLGTGCFRTFTVSVNPLPAAISSVGSVCVGSNISLTNATSGGGWTSGDASIATAGFNTGTVTGIAAGVVNITYTIISTGCFVSTSVTVNPQPAAITGTANACIGATSTLSSATAGGAWSSSNTSVATIDAGGVVTGVTAGVSTISYILGTGCFATRTVTVNSVPGAISGTPTVCVGGTRSLTDATSGGSWSSSDVTIATVGTSSGVVTGIASGNVIITYTVASTGCIATLSVTVSPQPAVITGTATVCAGSTTALANATGGGTWTSTNTSVATINTSGVVTGVAAGTTTISYTISTGCARTMVVTVSALPAAISGSAAVCEGRTTTLSSTTTGGTWTSSDVTVATIGSSNGVVTGLVAGTSNITYSLATGCMAMVTVTVNVSPAAITGTTTVCAGQTTTLANTVAGGIYSSSNASIASVNFSTGVVTGTSAGTATISYTLGNGCRVTQAVTVNAAPAAITGASTVCVGSLITLTDGTSGGTWSSSDGTIATVGVATGIVTGNSSGIANITYMLPAGCFAIRSLTVNPVPAAITGTMSVCIGSTTTLASATPGGTWTSASAGVATVGSASGVVTGATAGTTNITYTLATGCRVVTNITVNSIPSPVTGTASICMGTTTTFANATVGGTWTSSNTPVATVGSATGIVSGLTAGTSVISYSLSTGCFRSLTVTVNAMPATITGTGVVCVSATTTLANAVSGGTWTSTSSSIASVGLTSGVVTGVSAGTTTITYRLSSGCQTTTVVTVNPIPAAITGSASVCVAGTTGLSSTTSGGTWTSGDMTIATVGSATGVVTGVAPGTALISYTLGTGCFRTVIVTVNSLPAAITGTMALCAGTTTTLADATTGGTWSSSNPSVASINVTTGIVTAVAAGTTTISYRLTTGCAATTVVTVNALPAAITGTASVCVGLTTTLASATSGGAWTSSTPAVGTVSTSGVVAGIAAGTTAITYTLGTGCFDVQIVTVNALPAAIGGTASVCIGSTTTLTNSSTGGAWSTASTAIATVTSAGVVTGIAAGTTTITYTLGTGCLTTIVVTVNPLPAAITGTASVCMGLTTTLSNATVGGAWSSSNTSVATVGTGSGVVTGVVPGTAVITYTLATGCIRTRIVTVNPLPAAVGGPTTVCVGSTITLTNATAGGTWTSSNLTIATVGLTSGVVSGAAAGTVNITYTLATGCISVSTITVNPLPAVITGSTGVCVGLTTTLTTTTVGGAWSSSATAVATVDAAGVVTGVSAGTSTISYLLATGCSRSVVVTVYPLPAAIGGSLAVCVGFTSNLTNATGGGSWSSSDATTASIGFASGVMTGVSVGFANITYTLSTGCISVAVATVNALPAPITGTLAVCMGSATTLANTTGGGAWSSSNGAVATIDAGGIVTTVGPGTTTISYTLSTGCYRTATVTVNALPAAITGSLTVCEGSTTALSDFPVGGTWSSSTMTVGTISASGVVTGILAGTTTITYTLSTGCIQTAVVTVNVAPTAITGTASVCIGLTTTLGNGVAGGLWSSSNTSVASIDPFGVVTGVAAGTASITYTLGSGCRSVRTVTVNSLPAAITGTTIVCEGATTVLSSATTGGTWSSSSMTTAIVGSGSGVVTGVAAGTVTITYTATTSCIRTIVVTVSLAPTAITGTMVVCSSSTTTLGNTVPGGVWNSGNTSVATVSSAGVVTGIGAGTANITYTLTTGCSRVATVTVNATPAPISGSPIVCVGNTTNLASSPAGGTWSSSNTAVAIVSGSGVVNGVVAGIATITYELSTGCRRTIDVTVNAAPAAITGTGVVCVGLTTTLANASAGGAWNSSNTAIATIDPSGVVTGAGAGSATITYTLASGCSVTTIVTVNSSPTPITGINYLCEGFTTNLASSPSGGAWSSSNTSVAVISATGVVTGVVAGTTNITYMLTSGCYRTLEVSVNVTPPAISGVSTICAGSFTTFTNAVPGGNWTSSNTSVVTAGFSTGVITGVASGAATVTYTLSTGCRALKSVSVNPLPATIGGITGICVGGIGTLSNATPGGTWSSSDGSIVSIGSGTGIITGVATGTATISYTIGTGCSRTTVVTVNPLPAAISGTMTVCVGSTMFLSNAVTGGTWSSSSVAIATVGSLSGMVTGVSAGNVNITYTLSTGCFSVANVTVQPIPAAITGSPSVCIGSTTILSSTTFGGAWSTSNPLIGTVDAGGVVTGVAAGIVTISYSVSTGCARTINVTVNALPSPITGITGLCIGTTTTLFNATSGGAWSTGAPGIASINSSGVVGGVSPGTAIISYTIGTGCRDTIVVTVNPLPGSITGSTTICNGSTSTLSNAVTGGTWSTSNSAVASVGLTTGVVTGVAPGNATITYSLGSGCRATITVSVNTVPSAITGVMNICDAGFTTLTNATPGGVWSSSDPTIATITSGGVVAGIAPGSVIISYTMSTGCAAVATFNVNPNPPTITGFNSICFGDMSTLSNALTGGIWSSSNPSVASVDVSTGVVNGLSAGMATITYTLGTGCLTTIGFTVNALPAAITGPAVLCEGLTTTLSNSIGGGTWYSDDTTVARIGLTTGVVTGVLPGYATIHYVVGGSCSSSIIVTVNPTPPTIDPLSASICVGTMDTLSNVFGGGTWVSSNPSVVSVILSSGVITGISAGMANVTYTLGAGCYTISSVEVNPIPSAITGISYVCAESATSLFNSVAGGNWTSADPSVASVNGGTGVVTGVNSGNTVITYTLPGGCFVTNEVTVNSKPAPIAPITPGPLQVCAGSTLTLESATGGGIWSSTNPSVAPITLSTGIVSGVNVGTTTISYTLLGTGCTTSGVLTVNTNPAAITGIMTVCEGATTTLSSTTISGVWSSSDGTLAAIGAGTGVVTGLDSGLVTITYTLATGCYTTTALGINATPDAITGSDVICQNATSTLSSTTMYGIWSSSNTSVATVGSLSGVVTGVGAGTSVLSYTLGTGCSAFMIVTINGAPAALAGTPSVCEGSFIYLSSATAGGVYTSSNTAVAIVDGVGNVEGLTPGVSTISYTLSTGCAASVDVTVQATPSAIAGTTTVCAGSNTTLSNLVPGGSWTSANPAIATATTFGTSEGIITGVSAGSVTITYATPAASCFVTTVVSVSPLPAAIIGADEVCEASSIVLSNATVGGTWSSDNIGVATITTAGVVTGVSANTVVISYAVASGCAATKILTVNPLPFASVITGPGQVCVGSTITLADTVTGGTWISGDTAILKIDTTTGVVSGISAGTTFVTYTITNVCGTATVSASVLVNPLPSAGTISGNLAACIGYTTTLTSTITGGTWASSNTSVATINSSGIVTGIIAGSTTITYTVNTICGTATATVTLTVHTLAPLARIVIHPDSMMCSNVLFQNFGAAGGQPSGITYTWSAVNAEVYAMSPDRQNALVSFHNPGVAIVKLTTNVLASGCTMTDSFVAAIGTSVAFNPEVKYYNSTLITTDNTADSYQWGYDDLVTLDSTIIVGQTHQDYYLPSPDFAHKNYWVMTVNNGCLQKSYYNMPLTAPVITTSTDIRLFPNPADSRINIEVTGNIGSSDITVRVFDMLGKSVYEGALVNGKGSISVADLSSGIYSVMLMQDGAKLGARNFVKQ
ncbi:MAG: Ig-like domain-containing protein [Bacteroidota bacterium]